MHDLCIAVSILSGTIAAALLIAGFISLGAPDEADRLQLRERYAAAREKGRWAEYQEMMRVRSQYSDPVHIISRWPHRPQARGMIYVGAAFLALALIVGLLASRWPANAQWPNQAMQRTADRPYAWL